MTAETSAFNYPGDTFREEQATIAKSQATEHPAVVIPINTQHYALLKRNLLYTAITRDRKLVVLVGTQKGVTIAVKYMDSMRIVTLLKVRLKQFSTH